MKLLFLSVFVLSSLAVYQAQSKPVIAGPENSVIYRGLGNPLEIAVPEWSCSDLIVTTTNCHLTGTECTYTITPKNCEACMVTVKGLTKKDTTFLGEKILQVKEIPHPDAYLAGCTGTDTVFKLDLLQAQGIAARLYFMGFHPKYTVQSFSVLIIDRNNSAAIFHSSTNRITDKMYNSFKDLETGDHLSVEGIKATDTMGKVYQLNDIKLTIK